MSRDRFDQRIQVAGPDVRQVDAGDAVVPREHPLRVDRHLDERQLQVFLERHQFLERVGPADVQVKEEQQVVLLAEVRVLLDGRVRDMVAVAAVLALEPVRHADHQVDAERDRVRRIQFLVGGALRPEPRQHRRRQLVGRSGRGGVGHRVERDDPVRPAGSRPCPDRTRPPARWSATRPDSSEPPTGCAARFRRCRRNAPASRSSSIGRAPGWPRPPHLTRTNRRVRRRIEPGAGLAGIPEVTEP